MILGNLLILLLPAVISGFVCASLASKKGRDGLGWFFVGFFFLPIAIPFALIASPVREKMESMKVCDSCKERINAEASKCPYCQSSVTPSTVAKQEEAEAGAGMTEFQKLKVKAEELEYALKTSKTSSRVILTKDNKERDFITPKTAIDFLNQQQ